MSTGADHVAGKSIIVTGAGSGFGRLLVQKLTARGADVVAADVDPAGLAGTIELVAPDSPGRAIAVEADVTDQAAMHALVARCVEAFGSVDVLVNNAGIMPLAFFADHAKAAAAWDRCIDVNIKGVLHGIIAVHDQMLAQGRGHVVNLSSIYGNAPVVGAAVYGASKAAVAWFSDVLRAESQGRIKVTTVRPTGVPGTGLGAGVVNREAIVGIFGHQMGAVAAQSASLADGTASPGLTDPESIELGALPPELLADQIVAVIDQPWGVSISDITVRASGDHYLL